MARQVRGRVGQHLPVDLDVFGDGEAREGAFFLEGGKALGRGPGERATQRPAAAAQGHGHQLVRLRGKPGPCEADEGAAILHPLAHALGIIADELADIGRDEHGERARQQVFDLRGVTARMGLADFGEGADGAAEIIEV